ncbi:MAG: nucleoside kinase [Eubacteriales bacterium]|nr:nucleoside kinase [Eubacteriales bacterium]
MIISININDEIIKKEYNNPISYYEILKEYDKNNDQDILLCNVNGKNKELHKICYSDCEVSPIYYDNEIGWHTYRRSAIFILILALKKVYGKEANINLGFSIGGGLYVDVLNCNLEKNDIINIKNEFKSIVDSKIPIYKNKLATDEAITLFNNIGMKDKVRLFNYRLNSSTNIYSLSNLKDYFFGYMTMDTSYIKYFDIKKYGEGLVLLYPNKNNPKVITNFIDLPKLYYVQKESQNWAKNLHCNCIGLLNDSIANSEFNDLIMMQEAHQEKIIGDIADKISDSKKRIVLIAGPSSSGKTTFSHRLSSHLKAHGLIPHPIAVDNFFVDREFSPKDENGEYNFESLLSLDLKEFNEKMNNLLLGNSVEMPKYNFVLGKKEYKGDMLQINENDILVIEGIHCLNEKMSYMLDKKDKFKIYISALTQICIDEHNRIPTTDLRLIRRIVRDNRTRGYSAQDTIKMWKKVREGEENNIFPFQEQADVMFNSSLIYELSILKIFAEPILFNVDKSSQQSSEAKRLLRFLSYFLSASPETIPKNSIIREFIGGSFLDVG